MIKRVYNLAITSLLLGLFTTAIAAAELPDDNTIKPFTAIYDMYRQGDKLGQGSRIMTSLGDNNFSIELTSNIEWLIFSDRRSELSIFNYVDGKVSPLSYSYERSGTGSDKELTIEFRQNKDLIVKPEAKESPDKWEDGWLDEMSLHVQIQADLIAGKTAFEYSLISNRGTLRTYKLEVIGHEIISTGLGRFNAVKVARVYDKQKFYAQHAWFVPELNYTLARMWRMKKGVEQYDLVISQYTQH
ncbi:DUF3108 domain-containing protein [Psychrosphaera sp. B3R10]|uniref:DUF3108 domain-containing protein n=1 Tax=unclassified Psychrosphaera TaxID=2641570 RepID=UPI001C08A5C5|nr:MULTISPECIES: DUF3108 domain-containing protein [unclassified Psychrosphaera]MBU2881639.1 DUF3108 domain-containing protein [Psychrosphaera sp. I2R16]MBU2991106.1 DUF3108 domain-containing protein [Psychrosphaera sp. B3R10]